MEHLHVLPEGYKPSLDLYHTQLAIKQAKDDFEEALAAQLNLQRVSAPLFVDKSTGLNDDLNGVERPVEFDLLEQPGIAVQVVQSLAKWKRYALGRYGYPVGRGLYTDMNAIRRDETTDNFHSLYVDQWDWEKVIAREDRNPEYLKDTVRRIHRALYSTSLRLRASFYEVDVQLPEEVTFITTAELEDRWPDLSPEQRELKFVREHGAAFFMGIGWPLKNGLPHDGRAPDYDDWSLNADIVVYYPVLDIALELSSMGIRVDKEALLSQLEKAGCPERAQLPFQKAIIEEKLPYTIGGGIGQSRICMFFLRKAHIGEVQCSLWPEEIMAEAESHGIHLL